MSLEMKEDIGSFVEFCGCVWVGWSLRWVFSKYFSGLFYFGLFMFVVFYKNFGIY